MEIVIVFAFFVALALVSLRWGYDSRPIPYAKEHEQASLGLRWPERPRARPVSNPETSANGAVGSLAWHRR